MTFDWATYLTCAEELAKSTDEAAKRSSISRAYYAAYNVVRIFLNVTIPQGADSHKIVWDAALKHVALANVAKKGERLKERRKNADYQSKFESIDYWMKDTIAEAKKIIDTVAVLRATRQTQKTSGPGSTT